MYFLIEHQKVFKKYSDIVDICNKINNSMEKEFDREPVYNKKFQLTKIKFYGDKAPDFHGKEFPKAGSSYTCLVVILIDFILKKVENCYPKCS